MTPTKPVQNREKGEALMVAARGPLEREKCLEEGKAKAN